MRKPAFCISENKGADQLRSNCAADQRLCFRYTDSTINPKLQPLTSFCDCTARFVSDLVGNPNTGFLKTRLICELNFRRIDSSKPKIVANNVLYSFATEPKRSDYFSRRVGRCQMLYSSYLYMSNYNDLALVKPLQHCHPGLS